MTVDIFRHFLASRIHVSGPLKLRYIVTHIKDQAKRASGHLHSSSDSAPQAYVKLQGECLEEMKISSKGIILLRLLGVVD